MREIKVWGGTHGNEPLGIAVAESLIADPIPGVSAGIVDQKAAALGRRFIDINMIEAYPGDEASSVYEVQRAPAVLRESIGYFAVMDFHDYNVCEGTDNAFVANAGVSPEVLGFLKQLGFSRLIQATYGSLREHVPNGFSVDISLINDGPRAKVGYWRKAMACLVQDDSLEVASPNDFEWYKAYGSIHTDQIHPRELDGSEAPFARLPQHFESKLGLKGPIHWSCWNPRETNGYWAEICTPMAPPNPSNWPGFGTKS